MDWEFSIDRGGTFTDVIARAPDGRLVVEKLLSVAPHYADAASEAVRRILAAHGGRAGVVKVGTTIATNALLERKGEPVVLVTTHGLGDALQIGWQARPHIFARHINLPEPLHARVLEAEERVRADGTVERPLDDSRLRADLESAHAAGFRSAAVVFMHGWKYPAHEQRAAALARAAGFTHVTVSSEIAPVIRYVSRGDTAVLDAYLSPVLDAYVAGLSSALGDARLLFMQSNGGLAEAAAFRGKDSVLSGPAGGVVGMVAAGASAGCDRLIGFDMGGTSTDVCHYAGALERTGETLIAGVRLRTPMLAVETVAAGGGSLCTFDGARLRVGPASAGADPGPACYRRNGPLTLTDCNLVLGRILPEHFPHVFGPSADLPLNPEASHARLAEIADAVALATGEHPDPTSLAEGFIAIAVETMAAAIRTISVERGYDLSDHALVVFGGAGGQHACRVAAALGVRRIVAHPHAGVLSAWGIGRAPLRSTRERSLEAPLDAGAWAHISACADDLSQTAREALRAQGLPLENLRTELTAHLRYAGSDTTIAAPIAADWADMRVAFEAAHRSRFGFATPGAAIVVASVVADALGDPPGAVHAPAGESTRDSAPPTVARMAVGGAFVNVPAYDRASLARGDTLEGPAIVRDPGATTVIEAGWRGTVDPADNLVLDHVATAAPVRGATARDPVQLELFNNRFMAIAERMGATLQASAASVNIKERLDFSCAIFDGGGALVANAPHIPVHLGSMSDSVRALLAARKGALCDGDALMLNAPYNGGTHLPDITVIMPVFRDSGLAWFVAARGHHADIGGPTPGSMPARSAQVEDEGVLIDNFQLVAQGVLREAETRALFAAGPHPARNIDQNLADLKAQLAACAAGTNELNRLADRHGRAAVDAYMAHALDNGAECVRRVLEKLEGGRFVNRLDDGAEIAVRVDVDRRAQTAVIDFTGTSAQHALNFNAPRSVVRAAVLYVFRTLVDDAIPLNDGCMRPLTLRIPEGSMLDPRAPAAVVAGNVETSQAIVDALYGALGLLAGSQGTMNNFTFGNAAHQYYETICGGSGAGPDFDGASAVQVHMTNSRLTDPEVLETRHPVVIDEFSVRRGSGGAGAHRGGDGVRRAVRFLEPMAVSLLTSRRVTGPFGLAGGQAGAPGANRIRRSNGATDLLGSTAEVRVEPGDTVIIETPGGGGFGG